MMMPYHPHMLPMMMDPIMAQPAFSHGMSSHSAQQLARIAAAPQAGSATQQQQQHPQQQHQQQHQSQQQPVLLPREPSAHGEAWNEVSRDQLFKNRSEEHTSELQSLMRISYAVLCLKKNKKQK